MEAQAVPDDALWEVQFGPDELKRMSLDQLDDAFRLGLVTAATPIREVGSPEWLPLGIIAELDSPSALPPAPAELGAAAPSTQTAAELSDTPAQSAAPNDTAIAETANDAAATEGAALGGGAPDGAKAESAVVHGTVARSTVAESAAAENADAQSAGPNGTEPQKGAIAPSNPAANLGVPPVAAPVAGAGAAPGEEPPLTSPLDLEATEPSAGPYSGAFASSKSEPLAPTPGGGPSADIEERAAEAPAPAETAVRPLRVPMPQDKRSSALPQHTSLSAPHPSLGRAARPLSGLGSEARTPLNKTALTSHHQPSHHQATYNRLRPEGTSGFGSVLNGGVPTARGLGGALVPAPSAQTSSNADAPGAEAALPSALVAAEPVGETESVTVQGAGESAEASSTPDSQLPTLAQPRAKPEPQPAVTSEPQSALGEPQPEAPIGPTQDASGVLSPASLATLGSMTTLPAPIPPAGNTTVQETSMPPTVPAGARAMVPTLPPNAFAHLLGASAPEAPSEEEASTAAALADVVGASPLGSLEPTSAPAETPDVQQSQLLAPEPQQDGLPPAELQLGPPTEPHDEPPAAALQPSQSWASASLAVPAVAQTISPATPFAPAPTVTPTPHLDTRPGYLSVQLATDPPKSRALGPIGKGEILFWVAATLLCVTIVLQRTGKLHEISRALGNEPQYLQIERALLGAPDSATPRGVGPTPVPASSR